MAEEIIMRGRFSVNEGAELNRLSFTGLREGFAYQLVEFQLYPSTSLGGSTAEMSGVISCAGNNLDPANIDFNLDEIIGTAFFSATGAVPNNPTNYSVINNLYPITQDLVINTFDASNNPVNWQVKFRKVKLSGPAQAVANYKQYSIQND